jgi:putative exosortase-associated protein (TIGR04073 family)
MKFGKICLIALIAFFGIVCVNTASAADSNEPQWIMRPVEKLGRGIANVAFGVFELPMQWTAVTREEGGIAGLTKGTLKGVCYVVARLAVGVTDIITFPFPLPDCPNYPDDAGWGYGPIMRPAWVIPVGSDWNNFVYQDQAIVNPNL